MPSATAVGSPEWHREEAAAVIDSLAKAGRLVLGLDVRDYEAGMALLDRTELPFSGIDRNVAGFDQLPALLESLANGDVDTPMHAVFAPG